MESVSITSYPLYEQMKTPILQSLPMSGIKNDWVFSLLVCGQRTYKNYSIFGYPPKGKIPEKYISKNVKVTFKNYGFAEADTESPIYGGSVLERNEAYLESEPMIWPINQIERKSRSLSGRADLPSATSEIKTLVHRFARSGRNLCTSSRYTRTLFPLLTQSKILCSIILLSNILCVFI